MECVEFRALRLILIISPASELGITHRFFHGLLVLQRIFCQNFKIFSQPARPVPKVSVWAEFIEACMNSKHVGLFRSYLPHPTSELCTIFFMDSLFFKENSIKISKIFSTGLTGWHLVHRVSLYRALILVILVILEPNSYMDLAHELQISFGLYFGSIVGLILDSL